MRWVAVLLLAWCTACGREERDGSRAAPADGERRIAALEEQWIQLVARRDSAGFERLLAPGFVYTEDDRVYTRAQLIGDITTTADTVTGGHNEDMHVRVVGNTGIVTGWLVLTGHNTGRPFERRYRFTDTWIRTEGTWRVLAAQDYLKP